MAKQKHSIRQLKKKTSAKKSKTKPVDMSKQRNVFQQIMRDIRRAFNPTDKKVDKAMKDAGV